MADYKDYIVRYDIQANVANATIGMKEMVGHAQRLQEPLNQVSTALKNISSDAVKLRESFAQPFEPVINPTHFKETLQSMVSQVQTAASEMHAAIFNALKGSPQGTKAVQSGIGKALDGKRTIADVKRAIASIDKEIDKIMGPKDLKSGKRDAKQGSLYLKGNTEAQKQQLRAQRDDLKMQRAAHAKVLEELEKQEKQAVAAQAKTAKATKAAVTAPAKPTSNVTPAQIKAWKTYFGNENVKNLMVNVDIVDRATPALDAIKASLESLKSLGQFEVLPTLNKAAYTEVERQLSQLAALSQKVANPVVGGAKNDKAKTVLNKDQKAKVAAAQKQIMALNQAAAPIQERLNKNLAIPENERTSGVKGQITKDTKALATITSQAKEQETIISGIKGKPAISAPKTTVTAQPAAVEVIGKLSKIESSAKPLTVEVIGKITQLNAPKKVLTVDVVGKLTRVAPLEKPAMIDVIGKLVTVEPAAKALRVEVVGKLTQLNASAKISQIPIVGKLTEIKGKVTDSIPVNIKITAAQASESLKAIEPTLPPLNVKVRIMAEGVKEQMQTLTGPIVNGGAKGTANTTNTNTSSQPPIVPPIPPGANNKNSNSSNNNNSNKNQDKNQPEKTKAQERYEKQKKQAENIAGKQLRDNKFRQSKRDEYSQQNRAWYNTQQKMYNKLFEAVPKGDPLWAEREQQQRAQELTQMRKDARAAFSEPTPYEKSMPYGFSGSGKNQVYWGSQKPTVAPAPGHEWVRATDLHSNPTAEQQAGYKQAVEQENIKSKIAKLQRQQAKAANMATRSIAAAERQIAKITPELAKAEATWQKQIAKFHANPTEDNHERLKAASKVRGALKRDMILQSRAIDYWRGEGAYEQGFKAMALQEQIQEEQRKLTPGTAATSAYTHGWRQAPVKQGYEIGGGNTQFRQQRLNDAVSTFQKGLTPFEKLSKLEQTKITKPEVWRRYTQSATRFRNYLVNLGLNEQQMKIVRENMRFFERASRSTGFTPTSAASSASMLQYMQNVRGQMMAANAPIPVQMQSYITKLEKQVAKGYAAQAKSSKVAPVSASARPAYERFRRWSYPLTGPTSFGVRTPMAVDMAKGMGVMFAIGGAMSAISNSFGQAVQYQNTMKTTQAILQNGTDSYSQNGFSNMEHIVRDVGVKTKFSAPEVADAARFLAMAGFDINAINTAIRPIADLALIGDMNLGEVADKMTNIMTTFGASPDMLKKNPHLMRGMANIMTTTATRSNTDLMMLAESAKYGGGVAQMYGHQDPNLFADTMAIFGVMGNAGVQGSSAGTAIRMMYQNIFKPNKNQTKVLQQLKELYHIDTLNSDGSYRSMANILMEMAQKIPENKMAEIVGNLFRITAQPGATATIMAAAAEDGSNAEEVRAGSEAMYEKMQTKAGLSALASLMMANRASVSGNISGSIAEEKQNTISGLWAQVTSMFTEAIVQAFEQRQGGFAEMLTKLRDYFANPETVTMIQNLIDMIIKIGEVMAWFVKIWAGLYNAIPGLVKWWVVTQMAITQIGTLMAPISMLMTAFAKLEQAIACMAGTSAAASAEMAGASAAGASTAGASAASAALIAAPLGINKAGTAYTSGTTLTKVANKANTANAILAGELALSGASRTATMRALTKESMPHYAALQQRYIRRYRWQGVMLNAKGGLATSLSGLMGGLMGGIKSMFFGLMNGMAKAVGFLGSPVGLAIIALTALGTAFYKIHQYASGNTDAQITQYRNMAKAIEVTNNHMVSNFQWYKEKLDNFKHTPTTVEADAPTEEQKEAGNRSKAFHDFSKDVSVDITKDPSEKTNLAWVNSHRQQVNSNVLYKMAIGSDYRHLVGNNLDSNVVKRDYQGPYSGVSQWIDDALYKQERYAKHLQQIQFAVKLREFAANDPRLSAFESEIVKLRQQFIDGKIDSPSYYKQANAVRDKIITEAQIKSLAATPQTLEAYNNILDPADYQEYGQGLYNILTGMIGGDAGSVVGKMNAQYELRNRIIDIKKDAGAFWHAVSQIIGDYPVLFNTVNGEDVKQSIENIIITATPDGNINWQPFISKIQQQIAGFKLKIQDMLNMMSSVYKAMATAGDISFDDAEDMIRANVKHKHITRAEASAYYYSHVKKNPDWKGVGVDAYVDWVTSPEAATIVDGRGIAHTSPASERVYMRNDLADTYINNVLRPAQKMAEEQQKLAKATGQDTSKNTGNSTDSQNPPKSTTVNPPAETPPAATDQNAYASHYDRSVARPTQIVFNINEMAHFDRTTVASSAEERDLIAAMEAKIAPAVYQIFAQAANQANNMKFA